MCKDIDYLPNRQLFKHLFFLKNLTNNGEMWLTAWSAQC
nr:hypothetical protein GPVRGNEL_GPVRGNEL_CDS_0002 [Caudoviricetes sp.]